MLALGIVGIVGLFLHAQGLGHGPFSHGYYDEDKPCHHFLGTTFLCNGARQPLVDVLATVAK